MKSQKFALSISTLRLCGHPFGNPSGWLFALILILLLAVPFGFGGGGGDSICTVILGTVF